MNKREEIIRQMQSFRTDFQRDGSSIIPRGRNLSGIPTIDPVQPSTQPLSRDVTDTQPVVIPRRDRGLEDGGDYVGTTAVFFANGVTVSATVPLKDLTPL